MWSLYLQLSLSSSGHDTGLSPLSHILLDDFIYTQDFKLNTILYWKLANSCLLQISSLSLTAYLTSPHENHTSTLKLSKFKTPRTIPLPVSYISIIYQQVLSFPSPKYISKSTSLHFTATILVQIILITSLTYSGLPPPVLFPSYILSTSIQFDLLKI